MQSLVSIQQTSSSSFALSTCFTKGVHSSQVFFSLSLYLATVPFLDHRKRRRRRVLDIAKTRRRRPTRVGGRMNVYQIFNNNLTCFDRKRRNSWQILFYLQLKKYYGMFVRLVISILWWLLKSTGLSRPLSADCDTEQEKRSIKTTQPQSIHTTHASGLSFFLPDYSYRVKNDENLPNWENI